MKETLVNFRNKKGLTQQEMAVMLGTTLSYYSKIELGIRNPSYNFLVKFKKHFSNEKIDEIFFDSLKHEA